MTLLPIGACRKAGLTTKWWDAWWDGCATIAATRMDSMLMAETGSTSAVNDDFRQGQPVRQHGRLDVDHVAGIVHHPLERQRLQIGQAQLRDVGRGEIVHVHVSDHAGDGNVLPGQLRQVIFADVGNELDCRQRVWPDQVDYRAGSRSSGTPSRSTCGMPLAT